MKSQPLVLECEQSFSVVNGQRDHWGSCSYAVGLGKGLFSSVPSLNCVGFFLTPKDCSTPGFPVHHQLLEFTQTHVHPTISSSVVPFSSCLQSFLASESFPMSQLFALGGQIMRSFSFCMSPSNEYLGPISFRMDWLDLLAAQGTLKSLLQHHSSKASILRRSAFFIVQLSCPYMTTEKP